MVKWTVNGANFCERLTTVPSFDTSIFNLIGFFFADKTYKKRQVMNALELEEMQQQQQQYQQQQRQEARAAAAAS